ncbi:MAG: diguanylate cyclase domain-containing protein [Velocimicrobium sp.]
MDLEALLLRMKEIKNDNADELLELSKGLLKKAKLQNDKDYMAKALYNMSLAYWRKGQIEKTMSTALKALKYVNPHKDPETFVKVNNTLGILSYLDQNDTLALEYYLEGLEISNQYKMESLTSNFMINIGLLYQNLNHHRKSIQYFVKAEKIMMQDNVEVEDYYRRKISIYINFSISYFYLHEYERADFYVNQAIEYYEKLKAKDIEFIIYCIWCRIKVKEQKTEMAKGKLPYLMELFFQSEEEIDYPQDIGEFYELLIDMQEYEKLDRVISIFETYVEKQNIMSLSLQALDMRISYYKAIEDTQNYQKKCIEYYELKKCHTNETNEKRIKSIETRLALRKQEQNVKESEKINAHLQKKTEEDPLTHIGNRYRLERFYKRLIHEKKEEERKILAVGIIDVDFFKGYNDYYGHIKGDECLRAVANVISSFLEPKYGICARYGGDEFVLLLPNLDEKMISEIAEHIMKEVRRLKIPHHQSTVSPVLTVSQGYFIGRLNQSKKLSDYISQADKSLYLVKKQSRDSYHIRKKDEAE